MYGDKVDFDYTEVERKLKAAKLKRQNLEQLGSLVSRVYTDFSIKDVIDFLNAHKFAVKIIKPTQDDSELVMLYAIREKSKQ